MAKLILIVKGTPKEIELGQELTIGRGYSNLLRLDGDEISRVHAIIYRRDNTYYLRDLDSKNGVFVNGNQALTCELRPGDKLQIGKHSMIFEPIENVVPSEPPLDRYAPPPPPPIKPAEIRPHSDSVYPAGEKIDFDQSQLFKGFPGKPTTISEGQPGLEEVQLLNRTELLELAVAHGENEHALFVQLESEVMSRFVEMAIERGEEPVTLSDLLLQAMAETLEVSGAVIVLHDVDAGGFSPAAIFPRQADVAVNRVVMREGFSQGRGMLCPSTIDCGLFRDSTTVTRDRITSIISIPLAGGEGEAGLLYLDRKGDLEAFSVDDLVLASRIARVLELGLFKAGSQVTPPREVAR